MREPEPIGTAYDSVAAAYDGHVARDGWLRGILWRHFDGIFRPGDHVLDVGCGTGIDTLHLASRGIRMTAVDISPGMVAEMRAKLRAAFLERLVDVQVGDIIDLAGSLRGPFAGIVSSFAALNTVDLQAFARAAARLLPRGGRLICHMLSPGYFPLREPGRRTNAEGTPSTQARTVTVGGQGLSHVSLPADEVYHRFFSADFVMRRVFGLGLLVRDPVQRRIPQRLLPLFGRIDRLLGSLPFLISRGRFFVLDLERR